MKNPQCLAQLQLALLSVQFALKRPGLPFSILTIHIVKDARSTFRSQPLS